MKNKLIILYFRLGIDVLGFPIVCKHIIHRYENIYTKEAKINTRQEMI